MFASFPLLKFIAIGVFGVLPISVLLTRLMIRINISAEPMQRSSHKAPTPTAGGASFIVTFWAVFSAFLWVQPAHSFVSSPQIYFVLFGLASLILGSIGLKDDFRPLSYRFRLFVQLFCVLLLVCQGLQIKFPAFEISSGGWVVGLITAFCLLSLINGANFVDGLNGLLAGSFLISLIFNILILLPTSGELAVFYVFLFFSVLGFFIFNFPKAKIFMGDIGSTFLGLAIGFSALMSQLYYPYSTDTAWVHKGFIYTLTPLGFLWFDVGFTLIRRAFLGYRLTEPHRDHLIHILNDSGYSHTFISSIHFALTVLMGGLTLLSHYGHLTFLSFFLIYVVGQTLFCLWVFSQKRRYHKSKPL